VLVGYVVHSRWSFRGHGRRDNLARTGGRFVIVSLVSFGLNQFWVWLLVQRLELAALGALSRSCSASRRSCRLRAQPQMGVRLKPMSITSPAIWAQRAGRDGRADAELSVIVPVKDEEQAIGPFVAGSRRSSTACFPPDGAHLGDPVRRRRQRGCDAGAIQPPMRASRGCGRSRCRAISARKRRFRPGSTMPRAAVVPMDVDLQDPPEVIGEMLAKWREGYEVVYGVRRNRSADSLPKRLTADLYYRAHNYCRRQDPGTCRRLPAARPQGRRHDPPHAGAQPLHEGHVRLGRLPPGGGRI
jgi:hypothetical protein